MLLIAQLATAARAGDSAYASAALRALVARAGVENRQPPRLLRSYQSRIETEISFVLRDTLGRERTAQVEQFATRATWTRGGRYDLHIIGYRSQSAGVPYSGLSIIRGWTVPSLYGQRLSLGVYFARADQRDTLIAVHPFADDRDRFYRYSGGDTVATLRVGARRIPIVRIRVHPEFHGRTRLGAFDGEIDLDADRAQIVRMRGQFVVLGGQATARERFAKLTGVVAAVYVEFVNAEVDGKYWLPASQRTEFQASVPLFGQTRPVFRVVSSIRDIVVNDTGPATTDTLLTPRVIVSWATPDSVNAFSNWQHGLGTQSAAVHADDFIDLAPDAWRLDGPPRLDFFPNNTSRIVRFNRVEGLFLGVAPTVDFRNRVPGLSVGVNAGWAFSERTARGGTFVSRRIGSTTYAIRGERQLASTNDFTMPFTGDPGVSALLSTIDDYDYVDRRVASLSVTRTLGALDAGVATIQAAVGDDERERARLTRGLIMAGPGFRPNRGVDAGHYARVGADLEVHPNVTGDFVEPGVGLRSHYEIGAGTLNWQRIELGLAARRYVGPISLSLHADGGALLGGSPPPQQLFELGGALTLPGYAYKQFAGDRAALFRSFASYRFPTWKRPIHIFRNYLIPGLNPGIAVSVQGGWTDISSPAAARAVLRLGADAAGAPIAASTGGVRGTVGAGITLFSDVVHFGLARPIDHASRWRAVIGFGPSF